MGGTEQAIDAGHFLGFLFQADELVIRDDVTAVSATRLKIEINAKIYL